MRIIVCDHCGKRFIGNPRSKNQTHCGSGECQRARKRKWEQRKIREDENYRKNKKESQKSWAKKNPDYWKKYRKKNPDKTRRNRILQKARNRRLAERKKKSDAKTDTRKIAKTDALKADGLSYSDVYWLVPIIAKSDAFQVQLVDMSEQMESAESNSRNCKEGLDCQTANPESTIMANLIEGGNHEGNPNSRRNENTPNSG